MSWLNDRRNQALVSLAAGFALLLSGVVISWLDGPRALDEAVPASLSPRLLGDEDSVARIDITHSEGLIRLEREFEGWVVASENGYPANNQRVENLIAAVSGLVLLGERTRLAERHALLDLDDPQYGGAGLHIHFLDHEGRTLADIVAGRAGATGQVYVRQQGEDQTYLARGSLPPASRASEFMTLDFLGIDREAIRETCVRPTAGPDYCLLRRSIARDSFELVEPAGWQLVSPGGGDGAAASTARLRFRGVRPAVELSGPAIAEHRVTTMSGLELTLTLSEVEGSHWMRLTAIARSESARDDAVRLNELTDGWAYQLSDLSVDRLFRPLTGIAVEIAAGLSSEDNE